MLTQYNGSRFPIPAMIELSHLAAPRNEVPYMTLVSLASRAAVKSHSFGVALPLPRISVSHESIVPAQKSG